MLSGQSTALEHGRVPKTVSS